MNHKATHTVRAGLETDTQFGAVVPPLYLSSNYTFDGINGKRHYDYTRSGNPTRDLLADALAKLEKGFGAVITSTGMSAVHACLGLLNPGDLLLAPVDCYGGTHRLFTYLAKKGHFEVAFIDPSDPDAILEWVARRPKMIWLETPSNPLLRITPISAWCEGRESEETLVVVDNTFLSPILQNPLECGADLVVHSTTKYINGHSDVVGGAVISKTRELQESISWWANCLGLTGSPFDSYQTLRGLRTLKARMDIHEKNAGLVAHFLHGHPQVSSVFYPGLESDPGHRIALSQQRGFGGMLSFELNGGLDRVQSFVSSLTCFSLAESLGGVESLVAHPATMTHASMDAEARLKAGISDQLIRISVGIEDINDLLFDLDRALGSVSGSRLWHRPLDRSGKQYSQEEKHAETCSVYS